MPSEHLSYPRGRIAMDSGDLMDVTDVTYDMVNNAKQVHTIRRRGAGTVMGNEETTVSFNVAISEEGEERDYFKAVQKGLVKQIKLKIPGRTISVEGRYTTVGLDIPLDAEIKERLTFIGKTGE